VKSLSAKQVREDFDRLLDDAERGKIVLITRNSRPTAVMMPPEYAKLAPIVAAAMKEFGLSIEMSEDAAILVACAFAKEELEHGEIVWHEA